MNFIPKSITFAIIIFSSITFNDVFAYVDPGTGSVIIQAVIGALVAVAIGLKVYWEKLKMKFASLKK